MDKQKIQNIVENSWSIITPAWPVNQFVASNPLLHLQSQKFTDALTVSYSLHKQQDVPEGVLKINQETIKWLELFFDQGQATLTMPYRQMGLYRSCKKLFILDCIQRNVQHETVIFLQSLSDEPEQALAMLLKQLHVVEDDDIVSLLQRLLSTLPGWASYLVYYTDWVDKQPYPVSKLDYLLLRLMIMYVVWPKVKELLTYQKTRGDIQQEVQDIVATIQENDKKYQTQLLEKLQGRSLKDLSVDAQFIFCIDARSERVRRCLEQQGAYETFGYAGFFGIPVQMHNVLTQKIINIFPVLLKPLVKLREVIFCETDFCKQFHKKRMSFKNMFKTMFTALKYTFVAPFALVEILGIHIALWMMLRQFFPYYASKLRSRFYREDIVKQIMWPVVDDMQDGYGLSLQQQCNYALQALRMMGLTRNFGKVVVITSHRAQTENNAYQVALNCSACGSNEGLANAKLLATILNSKDVRSYVAEHGIQIPDMTYVLAAEHVTTTDEVLLYDNNDFKDVDVALLQKIKQDLKNVQKQVLKERQIPLGERKVDNVVRRSCDWSQIRPEWGLVNNAAMIIGPRSWTKDINLDGQTFLHSYDWSLDQDVSMLHTIMTGPMIVAYWINMQYLFSTIDPVVYGSGSKVTQNVTGKFGIMQGNTSDLMTGLPLQSVYQSDEQAYHTLRRLMVVVYAPKSYIQKIINSEKTIKQLVDNEWLHVLCYDPEHDDFVTMK